MQAQRGESANQAIAVQSLSVSGISETLHGQETSDSFRRTVEYLREAVELDPEFTWAYVTLSEVYAELVQQELRDESQDSG